MAASVASHIPFALSLLHYPGRTKSQPTTKVNTTPSAPAPTATTLSIALPGSGSGGSGSNGSQANSQTASKQGPGPGTTPPASSSGSSLCEHCHMKPKYIDGVTTHSYCSKSCASNAKVNGSQKAFSGHHNSGSLTPGTCDFCHNRPRFSGHPFCSKACAKNAISSTHPGGNPKGTCQAPGCSKPTHVNKDGMCGDYCSLSHKTFGETLCLMCLTNARQSNSHFCGKACADNAEMKGPMILEVPAGHDTFKNVSDQFKASWRHPGQCPSVKRVYKIVSPQTSLAAYNTYKAAVEARGQFIPAGRSAGNENRRWHGTKRECHLGDKGQTQFCDSKTCSLCCIVKTSFDLSLFGKKTGWGRFGKGIYTSSTSSKSNDYSHNECRCSLKAILLNRVVVGKGCKLLQDNVSLTAPPRGYDSVLAEKGGSLNYDELVVYTNDAIRPSFLVMYEA
ncbi:ADP-ribosylation [Gymnopus androsaceus JB14]|uniref:ADP-ribosylation n=1 Tax=Gymnopus androsaceus JB14 TaxID=1447944 RepID=A0A6A4HSA9_9AGAR|nr:ADP-ribosylation [Gymnopus androsaceus JB14]